MLREIKDVRQIKGELHRRWFTGEHCDLVGSLDAKSSDFIYLKLLDYPQS